MNIILYIKGCYAQYCAQLWSLSNIQKVGEIGIIFSIIFFTTYIKPKRIKETIDRLPYISNNLFRSKGITISSIISEPSII